MKTHRHIWILTKDFFFIKTTPYPYNPPIKKNLIKELNMFFFFSFSFFRKTKKIVTQIYTSTTEISRLGKFIHLFMEISPSLNTFCLSEFRIYKVKHGYFYLTEVESHVCLYFDYNLYEFYLFSRKIFFFRGIEILS